MSEEKKLNEKELTEEELNKVAGGDAFDEATKEFGTVFSIPVNVGKEYVPMSIGRNPFNGVGRCMVSNEILNSASFLKIGSMAINESTGVKYEIVRAFSKSDRYINADVVIFEEVACGSINSGGPISTTNMRIIFCQKK